MGALERRPSPLIQLAPDNDAPWRPVEPLATRIDGPNDSLDIVFERGAGIVRPPASPVLRPGSIGSGPVPTDARTRLPAFVAPAMSPTGRRAWANLLPSGGDTLVCDGVSSLFIDSAPFLCHVTGSSGPLEPCPTDLQRWQQSVDTFPYTHTPECSGSTGRSWGCPCLDGYNMCGSGNCGFGNGDSFVWTLQALELLLGGCQTGCVMDTTEQCAFWPSHTCPVPLSRLVSI
jgi:hypothetical protein